MRSESLAGEEVPASSPWCVHVIVLVGVVVVVVVVGAVVADTVVFAVAAGAFFGPSLSCPLQKHAPQRFLFLCCGAVLMPRRFLGVFCFPQQYFHLWGFVNGAQLN